MLSSPFKSPALRLNGELIQHPRLRNAFLLPLKALTGGGRTLQMPVFSAIGRILLMKAYGSRNSSQLGSKTGHSGGGLNSSGRGRLIVSDRPSGSSDRTGHRSYPRLFGECFINGFNNFFIPSIHRQSRWQPVDINMRGGSLHTHT